VRDDAYDDYAYDDCIRGTEGGRAELAGWGHGEWRMIGNE
jgi:hypothetical protein